MAVQQMLERHERTLEALRARLEEIPDPMWTWRPDPGAWSAAEVYDHVDRIARLYSFAKLDTCLRGEGRQAGSRTFMGWCLLTAPWLAGLFRTRREFPEFLVPTPVSKDEARHMLDALRIKAQTAARKLEGDAGLIRVEHVRLGWLTAEQWFAFAEVHSRHHLEGQLARLREAWSRHAAAKPRGSEGEA